MESFIPLLIEVVILVAACGFIGCKLLSTELRKFRNRMGMEDRKAIEILAASVGGTIERFPDGKPWIKFVRQGRQAALYRWCSGYLDVAVTSVEVEVETDGFVDVLSKKSRRTPKLPPRAWPVWKASGPFRVVAQDTAWAEKILAAGLLDTLQTNGPLHISVLPTRVLVEIDSFSPETVPVLLGILDSVVERVKSQEGGVEIVESKEESGGVCQVCSTAMDAAVVRCPKCQTPHHRDCWEYIGRCSTFGCGGTLAAG